VTPILYSPQNRRSSLPRTKPGQRSRIPWGHGLTFASRVLGESPPPPPRACFGRDDLIEEIVGLAENLAPIALVGAGGIGKTSIALTILHDDRVKQRFGENRRFIRCDQFPASCAHFLNRLSKVIGASAENPEDLAPLRPFLSSKDILIILDNAESILDPRGTGAREIYAVVEELSQFKTLCLCITSRISTIPPDCKTINIPTLSIESARDAFYRICKNDEQADIVDGILAQLEFHPLSITLLATVAHHNKWDYDRLALEWYARRTQVLRTDYSNSLAATIELSLASPMFQELGPDARGLLGVVAFSPQGINENNLDQLFPAISNRRDIFDKFSILSLTYRRDGFTTMLAPLRDYLRPKDPTSSPFLQATKECYLRRLSVLDVPGTPSHEEARWIVSEDVNVEHLLDVFTSVDANSDDVWNACANFMEYLYWHKPRLVALGPKVERLPDNHPSKPRCLFHLSRSFESVGNYGEYKRLLTLSLELWKERRDDFWVAQTLRFLAYVNWRLSFLEEGILQAKESFEIYKRLSHISGQAFSLLELARLLRCDQQLDAAEDAASRSIELLPDKQILVCQGHHTLGDISRSKGTAETAIAHFETALGIASTLNWHSQQFRALLSLAELFCDQGKLDDAHTHIERAKLCVVNGTYNMGHAMEMQARIWDKQGRFEEAKSEALCAAGMFEKLGAAEKLEDCRRLLQAMEGETKKPVAPGGSNFEGKFPATAPFPTPANSPSSARGS
jgi:tetratricopeptide (TPR) repeat protein